MNRAHFPRRTRALFGLVAAASVLALTGCGPSSGHATAQVPAANSTITSTTTSTASPTAATASPSAPAVTPSPAAGATPTAAPTPNATPTATPTVSPTAPPAPAQPPTMANLRYGRSGAAVKELQQKLAALGYWDGKADGHFGLTTLQAVYALQKAARITPTGVVTAATVRALTDGVRPTARSTSGRVIEVDLTRDLLMFVTDGQVKYILNTSTGGGYVYYDGGQRNVATTPKGHFTTYRTIDGPHRSSLGLLYRPRYFDGGFAIHGDSSVPSHPASHGCVRVSDPAMDWIWSSDLDPIGTKVWVY